MNTQEIGQVLALCAAFDQRTVGTADVLAWLEVIGDLRYEDAAQAVKEHYRGHSERITPAVIREQVTTLRRSRVADVEDVDLVRDIDPDDPHWTRILQGRRLAVLNGMPVEQAKAIPAPNAVRAIEAAR